MAKTKDESKDDSKDEIKDAMPDERLHDAAPRGAFPPEDGCTALDSLHVKGPVGGRDRIVRQCYEHVADAADGAWIYRRM